MVSAAHCTLLPEGERHAVVRDGGRAFHALCGSVRDERIEHRDKGGDAHGGVLGQNIQPNQDSYTPAGTPILPGCFFTWL